MATPAGVIDLQNLTQWLTHRTQAHDHARAALQWRLLEEGFGQAIAEAYRKGMQALWRITRPERPKRNSDGSETVKWKTIFACAGVAIEAAEDPGWTAHLSASEATLAAQHGCMTAQGYPEWIDALVTTHPQMVLSVLRQTLTKEWSSGRSAFLYYYANPTRPIPCSIQQLLFKILVGDEPNDLGRLDKGLGILQHLDLDDKDRRRLGRLARRRLHRHAEAGQNNHVLRYLAFLLLVDPNRAIDDLTAWLDAPQEEEKRNSTAELTFGVLFGQHDSLAATFLNNASVSVLEELLLRVYRYICPKDNERGNAEDTRNAIFKTLIDKPGEDAYRGMLRLSEDEHFSLRAIRLRELARGKAERDAELPSWSVTEVLNLERRHIAAVKTGIDLLRVVMAILDDIIHGFFNEDASSRPVREKAEDEDAVQNWLAEQLRLRARGRFHVHREAKVAGSKEPDITVSSTAAPCEVAIRHYRQ